MKSIRQQSLYTGIKVRSGWYSTDSLAKSCRVHSQCHILIQYNHAIFICFTIVITLRHQCITCCTIILYDEIFRFGFGFDVWVGFPAQGSTEGEGLGGFGFPVSVPTVPLPVLSTVQYNSFFLLSTVGFHRVTDCWCTTQCSILQTDVSTNY